jgi:hypothetical protein
LCAPGAAAQRARGALDKDQSSKNISRWRAPKGPPPQDGRVKLEYDVIRGTPGCDSETTFRGWIWSDLRVDPFDLTGAPGHVLRLTIGRTPARDAFFGVLELEDTSGRQLASQIILERTCARVTDVLLRLSEALLRPPPEPTCENACTARLQDEIDELRDDNAALNAEIKREREDRRREVQRMQEEWEAKLRRVKKDVEQVRKEAMELTYALSAGALITANLTPNVGPGVWLGGELRAGPLSIGLEFRTVLPASVTVGPYHPDLSQYVGMLVPCGRYLYFFGCGVAGAGSQVGYESSVPGASTIVGPLLQLGGRIGAEVPFAENRLAVRVWGEVLYSTPSSDFSEHVGSAPPYVWHRPDVSAFFGAGLVVKLGDEKAR